MDTLKSMQFFVRAVELGSFSAVARDAATTQPTISKAMAGLEKHLGTRLLERSTTSLVPTVQGQRFYERAKRVLEEYDAALADVRGLTESAAGLLRINAPVALGQFRLNALVQQFLAQYPEIDVELILNDRLVDLVEEGVDVAIRLGSERPPGAVARKVAISPRYVVASPAYLASHAPLLQAHDLARHDYVRFAWLPSGDTVELQRGEQRVSIVTNGRYRVNNALAIRESLVMGSGVGLCPGWLVDDLLAARQLVRVLPEWTGAAQELSLLYPSRRYQPLRARLLIDFLAATMRTLPGFASPGPARH